MHSGTRVRTSSAARIFAQPAVRAEIAPDPALAAAYAQKYHAYRTAWPHLRDLPA